MSIFFSKDSYGNFPQNNDISYGNNFIPSFHYAPLQSSKRRPLASVLVARGAFPCGRAGFTPASAGLRECIHCAPLPIKNPLTLTALVKRKRLRYILLVVNSFSDTQLNVVRIKRYFHDERRYPTSFDEMVIYMEID